jgi:transcriptional/translational regulatory protein YebC/TACO1
MFEHKCVFKFKPTVEFDAEEMELEMIDLGVDEFFAEDGEVTVSAPYESFGSIQKWIEDNGHELVSGEGVRIPTDTKELTAEEREAVNKLIEHLEEDDDVTNVYTTMAESDDEEE